MDAVGSGHYTDPPGLCELNFPNSLAKSLAKL